MNGEEKEQEITWYDDGEVTTGTIVLDVEEDVPVHVEMISEEGDATGSVEITTNEEVE